MYVCMYVCVYVFIYVTLYNFLYEYMCSTLYSHVYKLRHCVSLYSYVHLHTMGFIFMYVLCNYIYNM